MSELSQRASKAGLTLLLLFLAGCAAETGNVYIKDGKRYGVTSGLLWRERWWNYYERGLSYAEGAFWPDALADLQTALKLRDADQRRARTYGLHFLDYFPHRELGVVYYRLGRYQEAIDELETSLRHEESAKAKFYLNKSRREWLRQTGRDFTPPHIVLDTLPDGLVTRQRILTVTGRVDDDTYVASVTIGGQAVLVELSAPSVPFTRDMSLQDGPNSVEIVATDLLGRTTRLSLTVQVDRQGPLLSVERADVLAKPPRVRVTGLLSDRSSVRRFVLAGRTVALPQQREWELREEVPLTGEMTAVPFEAEDVAGNVTRGEITVALPPRDPPGTREGRPAIQQQHPRWAALAPEIVFADLPTVSPRLRQIAQLTNGDRPVIRLQDLLAQQTVYYDMVYLEGKVTHNQSITAFTINKESCWRRQTQQLFFGMLIPLHVGENRIVLEAVDTTGSTARQEVVVTRQLPEVKRLEARLRLALLPFANRDEASRLGETLYNQLLGAFVRQERFHLVERQRLDAVLREQRLSQTELVDPGTAVKVGKIAAAEGILIGTVTETSHALTVTAHFVDAETAVVMAVADVYGEEVGLPEVKMLMEGLAWKFQQRFPLVEGVVIQREGARVTVDRGSKHALKQYMKAILFREGAELMHPVTGKALGKPLEALGEARVEAVAEEFSQVRLLESEHPSDVRQFDKLITK